MNLGQHIIVLTLQVYRVAVSPVLAALTVPMGMGCRFTPTCSQYALEAVQRHGVLNGGALAVRRLCRCHPWGDHGPDPVPERQAGDSCWMAGPTQSAFPANSRGGTRLETHRLNPRL